VVPSNGSLPAVDELRRYLGRQLPDYMLPAAFVPLDALPLSPKGKLDRQALPPPAGDRPDLAGAFVAPRTPAEELLAGIWADVLGVPTIGVHDNFFALGGDSILSIQIVSRAKRAGLEISTRQLFQSQTVARLATVAGHGRARLAAVVEASGPAPLTPIQHWFFEQELAEPWHFNQAVLLQAQQPPDAALLERAVGELLEHHGALRLRFERGPADWQQVVAPTDGQTPFSREDLSPLTPAEQDAALVARIGDLHASLDLERGPVLRAALFDMGTQRPNLLFITIHHLAVDGVSWRILLEDLNTAYEVLLLGKPAELPPATTSFTEWARQLTHFAQGAEMTSELGFWLRQFERPLASLSVDYPDGSNTVGSSLSISVALSPQETDALLHEVPQTYHTQINDVLLMALAQALLPAGEARGLLVDLEGHGREDLLPELDLSRTVGWFTSTFPAVLHLPEGRDPGAALRAVKEQLRAIPRQGIGYGLLRYLAADESIAAQLRAVPQAAISFNYLGQFNQSLSPVGAFALSDQLIGGSASAEQSRRYVLDIYGSVHGGQLTVTLSYSSRLHRTQTIEMLANRYLAALREVVQHCQSAAVQTYTPSDFPLSRLGDRQLEKVLGSLAEDEEYSR
jgi:non-ribosomal peptide synthase protein (TIGR01720 family)